MKMVLDIVTWVIIVIAFVALLIEARLLRLKIERLLDLGGPAADRLKRVAVGYLGASTFSLIMGVLVLLSDDRIGKFLAFVGLILIFGVTLIVLWEGFNEERQAATPRRNHDKVSAETVRQYDRDN